MTRTLAFLMLALLTVLAAPTARAQDCETLAAAAGRAEGLPEGLLPAIARVESGRKGTDGMARAWPWTLNEGGKGRFFANQTAALDALEAVLATGARNVDIGCMQINHRWHAAAFASVAQMMAPEANTRYAARYLRELHGRLGSWQAATRAYHSRDADRGAAYEARVARAMADAGSGAAPAVALVTGVRSGLLVAAATPLFARRGGQPALPVMPRPAAQRRPAQAARVADWPAAAPPAAAPPVPAPPALLTPAEAPPRLSDAWQDIAALRDLLALQP